MLGPGAFARRVSAADAAGSRALLVLRLPEFASEAWRRGKRAAVRLEQRTAQIFSQACGDALRAGDCIAHESGSDLFLIALLAPARDGRARSALDNRSVLERIALALSAGVNLRCETGWSLLPRLDGPESLKQHVERALERGARERERYEFFAAVGHELRTPLTSIRGYLETLLESELDPESSRRFLETARKESLRMSRLIEGMFEFSLLDLSAAVSVNAQTPLDCALLDACEIVRPIAGARRIALERGALMPARVCIERDALVQMTVNLLDNAVKYNCEGGRVVLSTQPVDGGIAVYVDDDGPGIGAADAQTIFGLRMRGEHARRSGGSGIGLAIVKLIVERAGGTVTCGTSPLGGARFVVWLPCRAESAASAS